MKTNINQQINIDNIEQYIYNNTNIVRFTYETYLKYQELILKEENEIYRYKKVNNEHDKIFRTILDDKKEAVSLINKALNIKLEENQIEKYKEKYITENLINKETDIVYKIKNKKAFILIEHQTKIDYSMPYRVMEYQYKIATSAIDVKKVKQKGYKMPVVATIVLYTGQKRWDAKKYIKEAQEKIYGYEGIEFGKYCLVDINDYTEDELLEEETFLSKAIIIEKEKSTERLIEYLEKIIEEMNKEERYTKEQRELLSKIIDLILRRKIDNNEITERLIRKIEKRGGGEMLAVLEMIDKENRKILNKGIKKGKQEGIKEGMKEGIKQRNKEIAKILKQKSNSTEFIMEVTGLSKKEIEDI